MSEGKPFREDRRDAIRKPKKDQGFTLIEILIALTIFSVGMLAVGAMQVSSIKVNSTANKITKRMTRAQDKLEELMSLPYNDPWLQDLGDPPSGLDSAGNIHEETTSDGYTISWTVTNDSPVSNAKLVTVTVIGEGKRTELSVIKPDVEY